MKLAVMLLLCVVFVWMLGSIYKSSYCPSIITDWAKGNIK